MPYASLDPALIVATIARLQERIEHRFPGSGLGNVCGRLLEIANHMEQRAAWIDRPVTWLRAIVWLLVLVIVIAIVETVLHTEFASPGLGGTDLVQVLDAGFNVLILIGAAIFFLFSLETRYKRARALAAIHELRSVAHIIDMHQLTKDPERLLSAKQFQSPVSPRMTMTQFELRRYLDYCSEMLSMTGKIAAVYIQRFDDPSAIEAASDLESLATGLSRKIWQKILILHTFVEGDGGSPKKPLVVE